MYYFFQLLLSSIPKYALLLLIDELLGFQLVSIGWLQLFDLHTQLLALTQEVQLA